MIFLFKSHLYNLSTIYERRHTYGDRFKIWWIGGGISPSSINFSDGPFTYTTTHSFTKGQLPVGNLYIELVCSWTQSYDITNYTRYSLTVNNYSIPVSNIVKSDSNKTATYIWDIKVQQDNSSLVLTVGSSGTGATLTGVITGALTPAKFDKYYIIDNGIILNGIVTGVTPTYDSTNRRLTISTTDSSRYCVFAFDTNVSDYSTLVITSQNNLSSRFLILYTYYNGSSSYSTYNTTADTTANTQRFNISGNTKLDRIQMVNQSGGSTSYIYNMYLE